MNDEPVAPQPSSSADPAAAVEEPPQAFGPMLRRLGPGMIIAASIVGSGELIGATKTGAEAGFSLLWLIVIGCVIKLFTQVELGRYSIVSGETTMTGMNELPGPRLRVNWLMWYWLVMFLFGLGQLGGIVGGVGQAMAISLPISGDFNRALDRQEAWDRQAAPIRASLTESSHAELLSDDNDVRAAARAAIDQQIVARLGPRPKQSGQRRDDVIWAAIITAVTIVILVFGRYKAIERLSTLMVAGFTAVTVFCVIALQTQPDWAIGAGDLAEGFRFGLPPATLSGATPVATALATFGIIGVGATELIFYPYWCLEKGYARFTGPRDASPAWGRRAAGWMRVMRCDAWCSLVIYTFATIAFYLLGATVLHRSGQNPSGDLLVRTLAQMYTPVFGAWAQAFFLFGAFAVLYSTFFVATASHARTCADALRIFRLSDGSPRSFGRWTTIFCVIFPVASLGIFIANPRPDRLVLASGVTQAIMLPMLGAAALFFRYRRCDERIKPGKLWDALLWISFAGLLVAAIGAGVAVLQ